MITCWKDKVEAALKANNESWASVLDYSPYRKDMYGEFDDDDIEGNVMNSIIVWTDSQIYFSCIRDKKISLARLPRQPVRLHQNTENVITV